MLGAPEIDYEKLFPKFEGYRFSNTVGHLVDVALPERLSTVQDQSPSIERFQPMLGMMHSYPSVVFSFCQN